MEARVGVGVTLLVALSLGAVLFATTRAVTSRSLHRASEDLDVARSTFYQLLTSRAESAAALARLVTELPVVRAHMTDARLAADESTVDQMANSYRQQLGADFVIVSNAQGTWLGMPGWPAGRPAPEPLRSIVSEAVAGRERRDIVSAQDRLFLVVAEPMRFADEILGAMAVAYALDDRVAEELAHATHCDVSLVSGSRLSGSSLKGEERRTLEGTLAAVTPASARASAGATLQTLGSARYVSDSFPLFPGRTLASGDYLVLLQDWAPTQQFLDTLEHQFLAAGALIFAFALISGLAFSRRMSKPLREIAAAAGEISAGNWTRQVPVSGSSEATTMAMAFNEMSLSLRGAQERLLHDALHDHLTQLPNRALFMDRLQRAISRRTRHPERTMAVLFVDLDRFKTVNDSIGHATGDRLLLEIASRLIRTLRYHDTVSRPATEGERQGEATNTLARVGGDEFTILLEDIRNPTDAVRVSERIQEAVALPINLDGREVFASASVGIAISQPGHCSGEDLVRDAGIAMCRAKADGGNRCAVSDPTMHHRAVERLQLETDLRRAIERHEFRLQYQPIVSLHDQRIVGFEALLRWQHPERGLLMPAAFLATAEETGLISRMDQWVLGEACDEARKWQSWFARQTPPSISVNLSAQGFGQPDLVRQVQKTLLDTGLNPQSLRLEITESVAMADAERARTMLADLRALGVRISLDDFGTGYSSLSYLQRFPVDTLKIDQSFVAGLGPNEECREIIRTILNLARTLRLDVVAEGTETWEQVEFLERLECKFGQGYFFSEPIVPGLVRSIFSDPSFRTASQPHFRTR